MTSLRVERRMKSLPFLELYSYYTPPTEISRLGILRRYFLRAINNNNMAPPSSEHSCLYHCRSCTGSSSWGEMFLVNLEVRLGDSPSSGLANASSRLRLQRESAAWCSKTFERGNVDRSLDQCTIRLIAIQGRKRLRRSSGRDACR